MFELSTTCRFLACSPWRTPLLQSRQNKRNQRRFSKMEEVWKKVEGFEGFYEVSDLGRVRSWIDSHRNRIAEPKILNPANDRGGYLFVNLYKDGRRKTFLIHRLVAQAFIPNPGNLPQVNHIDECKTDNRATNLEWCSPAYNSNYGTRNERLAKANSRPVLQYDLSGNFVRKWPSTREIYRQTGWNRSYISACCLGKYQSAYHHVWRYLDDTLPITVESALF